MNRRRFLRTAAALAGSLAASRTWASAPLAPRSASDLISLAGKLQTSRLSIGTGSSGWNGRSNQTALGLGKLADLLEDGFDRGVRFWDAADQYGSHPHLKEGLKRLDRGKVTVLTKSRATTADGMKRDLERFRQEIGTDYLDIVLLHCLTDHDWPSKMEGPMDVLAEARESGLIRMHGVSCHSLGALKTAAETDWVQVDLARINPVGTHMDAPPDQVVPVLQAMKARGKAVIGMKVFGAGKLVNRKDECLRYVMGLDCVDAFTIGVESREQLADLTTRIEAASREA